MFTTTSPSRRYFILAYTRSLNNGPFAYFLNSGAAHSLSARDEFAVYPDMDCLQPSGTLIIEKVGSFYSIMQPDDVWFPVSGNTIATQVKEERQQALHIYSCPRDNAFEFLSPLQDSAQDLSSFLLLKNPISTPLCKTIKRLFISETWATLEVFILNLQPQNWHVFLKHHGSSFLSWIALWIFLT